MNIKEKSYPFSSAGLFKKILFAVFIFNFFHLFSPAQENTKAGKIVAIKGDVRIERNEKTYLAKLNVLLLKNDIIQTGPSSFVTILLNDGSSVSIHENTRLSIEDISPEEEVKKSTFNLLWGKAKFIVSKIYREIRGSFFEVKTPTAVTGVRGTRFIVHFNRDESITEVFVLEGNVFVENLEGERRRIALEGGRFTRIFSGKPPEEPGELSREDMKALEEKFRIPEDIPDVIEKDERIEEKHEEKKEEMKVPRMEEPFEELKREGLPPINQDPSETRGKIRFKFK